MPSPRVRAARAWDRLVRTALRRAMLVGGLGWAMVPRWLVDSDLQTGRLVTLELAARSAAALTVPLFAVHRLATPPPGPASRVLVALLANHEAGAAA